MQTPSVGLSVELRMGPQYAILAGGDACEHPHWDFRWSSLRGNGTLSGVGETHANAPIEAFGEAPWGREILSW
eukprot:837515-Pyramimonas_sp.AAC.1